MLHDASVIVRWRLIGTRPELTSVCLCVIQVSTLDLFKAILADQKSFPQEQPYKDLLNLVNFILRRFFKALEEEPFLAVEVRIPPFNRQYNPS
jgi:hypothetical protein